jgi:hypothetical protein
VTAALAINASGSVVGYFGYGNGWAGFVAHPDGYWAEITIPAAPGCAPQTIPNSINAAGMIAGWATNVSNGTPTCTQENARGFVMSPDGGLTLFQPPGLIQTFSQDQMGSTSATPHYISIDQAGDITGFYQDTATGFVHGFVRNPYGTITTFDPPEGTETNVTGINDGGAIAGFYQYYGDFGHPVGFIRVPQ